MESEETMDLVSIVLSTYNGEKYLREQLDSILTGTYQNIRIEISDDCSGDNTLEIVKEYQEKYPEQIYIHQNEKNLGYTMNFLSAIERSVGDYIMLCDQDDIWNPDKVEKTLAKMKESEKNLKGKPVLVFTDAWLYDEKQKGNPMPLFHKSSHLNTKKVDISHLLIENKCIGCTTMVNKEIKNYISKLPDSDEIRVHDWWLALICSLFGGIFYLDEPTLKYRQHGGNMIGGTSFGAYFANRLHSLKEQRQSVIYCTKQAGAFLRLFGDVIEKKDEKILSAFTSLMDKNWFVRHYRLMWYGFWKSGISRNVGLFIIL